MNTKKFNENVKKINDYKLEININNSIWFKYSVYYAQLTYKNRRNIMRIRTIPINYVIFKFRYFVEHKTLQTFVMNSGCSNDSDNTLQNLK